MELDEALHRSNRLGRLVVLVVGVGDLDLRLLREAPIRIARLELFEILDGLFVVAVVEVRLRLGIELLRRPALGLVYLLGQQAAGRNERPEQYR